MSFLNAVDTANPANFDALKLVYISSLLVVAVLVIGIFFNRGFIVILGIIAYLFSLSTITIAMKSVFSNQKFNFPKFVTSAHFLCCGVLCFGIMMYRQMKGQKPVAVPSMKQMWGQIFPIAVAFAASVGANNVALVFCNAAFAEMMSGLTPVCVIFINLIEGKVFDLQLLCPVLAVMAGVCMCAVGELKFSVLGFFIIFIATCLRAFKINLQQKILGNQSPEEKLEPVELLGWMSPPCLMVMALWGGLTEGFEPIVQLNAGQGLDITLAIGVTCVNACILNVTNNVVIRDLGAVGAGLTAQLKGILVLMGASVMLGEVIQLQQIAGYIIVAGGVYFYNKIDKDIRDAETKKMDIEDEREKAPLSK